MYQHWLRLCIVSTIGIRMFLTMPAVADEPSDKRTIVCSTTQLADFARQIVGDRWHVECVLAPRQYPHLYQTAPNDVRLVEKADLCLANGWHLEGGDWMKNLADDAEKSLVMCVDGVKPLLVPGVGEEESQAVTDPHGWFTSRNAAIYVRYILRGVSRIDAETLDLFI